MPTCTSIANASIDSTQHDDGHRSRRQRAEAVAAEHHAHRADPAGDADAGGEELEDQQRQADDEQQEGHRRAGDGVHHLVDQAEAAEHRHGRDVLLLRPCR